MPRVSRYLPTFLTIYYSFFRKNRTQISSVCFFNNPYHIIRVGDSAVLGYSIKISLLLSLFVCKFSFLGFNVLMSLPSAIFPIWRELPALLILPMPFPFSWRTLMIPFIQSGFNPELTPMLAASKLRSDGLISNGFYFRAAFLMRATASFQIVTLSLKAFY